MRTSEAVIVALLFVLIGGALLLGDGGGESARPAADVAAIARRVEAIRELRFRRTPAPRVVRPEQARAEGVEELDREYPLAARRADEELLALLGLVEPGTDLRRIEASLFEGQVAGYYDTRRRRLTLIRGAAGGAEAATEIVLAHELTHALEDDRVGLDDAVGSRADADTAYAALVEGTATAVMSEYARRHIRPGEALGAALGALGSAGGGRLPPYIRRSLEFPYLAGQQFVERLYRVAGGWKLVDHALRSRAPASTEQVLHPEKYLHRERPARLRLRIDRVLDPSWRRVSRGSVGELDTRELLRVAGGLAEATEAAAGWDGGRFELWRRGPLPADDCPSPCRARDVLVAAWRWDTPRDRHEFERALERYAAKIRAVTASRGGVTTLAIAPTTRLAARLANAAAR